MSQKTERPPLGLRPRHVADSLRVAEIAEAVDRYAKVGLPIPGEWTDEVVDILAAGAARNANAQGHK